MVRIWYASLTEVARAADIPSSALFDAALADVLDQATDAVREACHRDFEPTVDTRWFSWPQDITQNPRMLRLGRNELVSVSAITNGDGEAVTVGDVTLIKEGAGDDGPPYNAIINPGGWNQNADVKERSIGITGVYSGCPVNEQAVALTVSNLTGTTVDIDDSSLIGVGSLIRIGTERLVVTRRGWLNSGNLASITLDAEETEDIFTVTDGTDYRVNETLLIESEQMLITDIVDNRLIVQRAYNGSALAAHTAQTVVYVNRRLTVERAVLGTEDTDTASGATVYLYSYPGLVRQLCKAEALQIISQDAASYGSRSGSNQGEMPMAVKALPELRARVVGMYGRFRSGAI